MADHPVGSTFEYDGVTWVIEGYEVLTVKEGLGATPPGVPSKAR